MTGEVVELTEKVKEITNTTVMNTSRINYIEEKLTATEKEMTKIDNNGR